MSLFYCESQQANKQQKVKNLSNKQTLCLTLKNKQKKRANKTIRFCSTVNKTFHIGIKFYNYFSEFQFMETLGKEIELVDFPEGSSVLPKNQVSFYLYRFTHHSTLPQPMKLVQNTLLIFIHTVVYVAYHHFAYKDILQLHINLKMDTW